MYKLAIVEDDDSAAQQLQTYFSQYSDENSVEFDIQRFSNGVDFISDYQSVYDIVLMDIEMPMMDGMETARRLRAIDENVILIFVTNMAQQAINGYEVNAVNFLVKPVSYFKFSHAISKVIDKIVMRHDEVITVRAKESFYRLSVREIIYIEVYGHFLYYYTAKGKIEARGSLVQTEKELEPLGFARCNDCYIVNLRYVLQFNSKGVKLGGCEEEIPISRRKKNEFLDKLNMYINRNNV